MDKKGNVRYGTQPLGSRSMAASDDPKTAGILRRYKAAKDAGNTKKAEYWMNVLKRKNKSTAKKKTGAAAKSIRNPKTLAYKRPEEITRRDSLALLTMGMRSKVISPGGAGKFIVDGAKAQKLYKKHKGKPEAYLFAMLAAITRGKKVDLSKVAGIAISKLAVRGDTMAKYVDGIKAIQKEYIEGKLPELRQLISSSTGKKQGKGAAEQFESTLKKAKANEEDKKKLLAAQSNDKIPDIPTMEGVNFFPVQRKGINWLLNVKRGILAFGTGVGKTLTAIGATESLKSQGEIDGGVVFAPKSVCGQWKDEIEKFSKGAKVVLVRGDREDRIKDIADAKKNKADYIIVGWSALSSDEDDEILADLADTENRAIILDEGIRVKNLSSRRTRNFKKLFSGNEYIWNMTATPVGNNPLEMHTMLDMLQPGILGSRDAFVSRYYKKTKGPDGKTDVEYVDLDQLHKEIEPYVFVKHKDDPDVEINLAPVIEVEGMLDMATDQAGAYKNALRNARSALLGVKNPAHMTSTEKMNTLAAITIARQVAIDPALVDPEYKGSSVKIDRTVELLKQSLNSEPDSGNIVFSVLGKRIFPKLADRIAKETGLSPEEIGIISGDTPGPRRDEIRQKLNSGEIKVALLSMDAASEGMNLQKNTNMAYMLDYPWNPTKKEQAIGRIHRRGQERQVYVGQFSARGTVDEYMSKLLKKKRKMIDAILGDKVTDDEAEAKAIASQLDFDDFAGLLGYTREQLIAEKSGESIEKGMDEILLKGVKIKNRLGYVLRASKENPRVKRWFKTDAPAKAKEPWEMTRWEYVRWYEVAWRKSGVPNTEPDTRWAASEHKYLVEEALNEGKNVPPEALEEYPELKKRAKEKKSSNTIPATISIDGIQRPTRNSEGQPIHPTLDGIKKFWEWFGDSKVVDKDGKPLVVYHGTEENFQSFKEHVGHNSSITIGASSDIQRSGFFFTPNKDFAKDYGELKECYLQINKLWEFEPDHVGELLNDTNIEEDWITQYGELSSPKWADPWEEWKMYDGEEGKRFVNALRSIGYDGVLMQEPVHDEHKMEFSDSYVIFSPTQIKSATGNAGTFDANNPDITKSITDRVSSILNGAGRRRITNTAAKAAGGSK